MLITQGSLIDGKFQVRGPIGRGGMGVVYEADQLHLDRVVALKLLFSVSDECLDEAARFEREAVILSRLSHVNIVQFYAYGTWNGLPYIAMERLVGDSLHKLLAKNEPLPLSQTIEYVRQICDGLDHAHAHGIFHRDIKPSNIIISCGPNGNSILKIIDFGLAKLSGIGIQKLTEANTAVGSVQYMCPEQCTGKSIDHRSDIYSAGCLLYHCLLGHPPFCADNAVAVMFQQVNDPVQTASGWHLLPSALQDVLTRCMAKEPADRFQSCRELRDNLVQATQSESVAVSVAGTINSVPSENKVMDLYASRPKKSLQNLVPLLMTGAILLAGIAWRIAQNTATQTKNPNSSTSLSSPKEIITERLQQEHLALRRHLDHIHLSQTEAEELAVAVKQFRQNPANDPNLALRANLILVYNYKRMGEIEKLRSVYVAAADADSRATDYVPYVWMLYDYHGLCTLSGCELSLFDKVKAAKRCFPNMDFENRSVIDLMLAHDYARLGRELEARQILLSITKKSSTAENVDRAKTLLKKLDDKTIQTIIFQRND